MEGYYDLSKSVDFLVKYGIRGTFYCHKISKKYTAYEALESMKR